MDVLPAIDIRDGRCVRLEQGEYARETVYGDDPVAQARRFADAGARWIHVVDLDAARAGEPVNREAVAAIAAAVAPDGVRVQSGGGVRSLAAAGALANVGVSRVVIGTAAVEQPDLVDAVAAFVPVAVGLDVRGREVAVRGWTEGSGQDLFELVARLSPAVVAAVVVTQIGRDGTLAGPDLDGLAEVLAVTDVPVIASGGVGSLADLHALEALEAGGRRLAGAIVGKAIYEGAFSVEEALSCVSSG